MANIKFPPSALLPKSWPKTSKIPRIVITNTLTLFCLHQINRLALLQTLHSQITVPTAVQFELEAGQAQGLSIPNLNDLSWITLTSAKASFLPNVTDLGEGEAEVMALGIENPGSLLILNDALGRQIAQLHNSTYTGTLGVLIRAKQLGYVEHVNLLITSLQAKGMWLTPSIIENVLKIAKEQA